MSQPKVNSQGSQIPSMPAGTPAVCQPIWDQIVKYEWDHRTAIAIVQGESSCTNMDIIPEKDGSTSVGPWQINSIHDTPDSSDRDPFLSTQYAYGLYKARLARGQAGFSPWGAYTDERYKLFLK
jgi:hypothetical protein